MRTKSVKGMGGAQARPAWRSTGYARAAEAMYAHIFGCFRGRRHTHLTRSGLRTVCITRALVAGSVRSGERTMRGARDDESAQAMDVGGKCFRLVCRWEKWEEEATATNEAWFGERQMEFC